MLTHTSERVIQLRTYILCLLQFYYHLYFTLLFSKTDILETFWTLCGFQCSQILAEPF